MLDSINGLNNESNRLRRPADPKFTRLVELVRDAQLGDSIQYRIEATKEGPESSVIAFPPRQDPAAIARRQEISTLLGLKPNLQQMKVYYGAYSGKDDEIDMKTRSMLEIMLEFAAVVQVPESDVAQGKAAPGPAEAQATEALHGPPLRVLVADSRPPDPHVAVQYDGRWFWISNTDLQSKQTFGIIMLLFSIADIGAKAPTPTVTIPAAGP
jgi:hypothetical protein